MTDPAVAPPSPRALTIDGVTQAVPGGLCRSTVFNLIRDGKLKARKIGAKTIVLAADLDAFLATLPDARENPSHDGRGGRWGRRGRTGQAA